MDLSKLSAIPYFMEAFQDSVRRYPQQPMFVDAQHPDGFTRAEVDELSGRVYAYLKQRGVGREDMVMICLPRGAEIAVAAIGVWKAGAACTLAEDDLPAERLAFIRKDSGSVLTIDSALWPEIMQTAPLPGFVQADDHDAAFAVYTSGSTGTPKGVLQEYGCFRLQTLSTPDLSRTPEEAWTETMIPPFHVLAGAAFVQRLMRSLDTVHILPYEIVKDPPRLNRYFSEHGIDRTYLPPSALRAIGGTLSPSIRFLTVGGESTNGLSLDGLTLECEYAMSESGFPLCRLTIDRPYALCPVGRPTTDAVKIHLLDEDGQPVPDGEAGEICFEAPFFRGYINRPEETKEAFRGGLFHSGDLGRWDENGNLVITGRTGDMLKVNGNRVEPSEIESVFRKLTGQDWCAVRGFAAGARTLLCLYYQGEQALDEAALRREMGAYLPGYMLPARFQRIDAVPLLPGGKTDKSALPEPDWFENRPAYVPPETEEERTLCRAFEAVFEIAPVGLDDDFFDLGGDSVAAMAVLAEADLPGLSVLDIFEGRTLRCILEKQAQRLDEEYEEDYAASEARERALPHLVPSMTWLSLDNAGDIHLPGLLRFDRAVGAEKLCDALNRAVANRSVLSMVVERGSEGAPIWRYDASRTPHYTVQRLTQAEFDALRPSLLYTFEMYGAPLIHAGVYETEQWVYLFHDVHHMIMDGSAMPMLYDDIEKAYRGERLEQDTYCTYLCHLERERATERYRKAREGWTQLLEDRSWHSGFTPDQNGEAAAPAYLPCKRVITRPEITALSRRLGVSENLLCTGMVFLAQTLLEGEGRYLLLTGYNNRSDTLRRNAFGYLVTMPVVTLETRKAASVAGFFAEVKASWVNSIANLDAVNNAVETCSIKNEAMFILYQTYGISGDGALASLGAQPEELQLDVGEDLFTIGVAFTEQPDFIVPLLMISPARYSAEKQQAILDALTAVIDRLAALEDPERTTVGELLT